MPTVAELRAVINADGAARGAVKFAKAAKRIVASAAGINTALTFRRGIRAAAEFDDTMRELQAVAVRTTRTFEQQQRELFRLEQAARDIGRTTSLSAKQAAEGLLFLARAGFSVDEAIGALPASVNLARVGVLDLGRAADIATNIMTQFGIASKDLDVVIEDIVNVSIRSNTSIEQMAQALKFAGPIAKQVGLSVLETAAAIGVLGNAGIQATHAGTNLRQILAKIAVEIRDKGVLDAFRDLNDEEIGLEGAFETFERRAAAGALQLIENVELQKQFADAAAAARGSVSDLAVTMDTSLGRSITKLTNKFQDFAISLEKSFLGEAFQGIIDGLGSLVSQITSLTDGLRSGGTPEINKFTQALDKLTTINETLSAGGPGSIGRETAVEGLGAIGTLQARIARNRRLGRSRQSLSISELIAIPGSEGRREELFTPGTALNERLREAARDQIALLQGNAANRYNEFVRDALIDLRLLTGDETRGGQRIPAGEAADVFSNLPPGISRQLGLTPVLQSITDTGLLDAKTSLQEARDFKEAAKEVKEAFFKLDEATFFDTAQNLTKSIFDPINRAFQTADFSSLGELIVRRLTAAIAAEALKPAEQFLTTLLTKGLSALGPGIFGPAGGLNAGSSGGSTGTPDPTGAGGAGAESARVAGATTRQSGATIVSSLTAGRS